MFRGAMIAAALAFALPTAASATTYDLSNYGASYFSYGYGTAGTSYTTFTTSYAGGCFSVASLACMTSGTNSTQPVIAFNTGAATTTGTVTLPANGLLLHPGPDTGQDAILTFIVPVSAVYTFSGNFQRLDNTDSGDGVVLSILYNGAILASSPFGTAIGNPLASYSGAGFLNAGDTIAFAIGKNGEYTFDSTGLTGSFVNGVPEPTTWGLMILGFGAVGATMRRRNVVARTAIA